MAATPERLVILLVDDDQQDALLIQRALSPLEPVIRLVTLTEGEEAIAYLVGNGAYADRDTWPLPNVILLDHWMPRVSGLDVLTWIAAEPRFASTPVVLMSGGLAPAQQQEAETLGAVFCAKELTTNEIEEALFQALDQALSQPRQRNQPSRRPLA